MTAPANHTLLATYNRFPLTFVRGEGSWLYTDTGERFLDLVSGIAVNTLGHADPGLVEVLQQQAARLWHVSNLYHTDTNDMAADAVVRASGFDRVFFCNSGAEANEGLFKLARRHGMRRLGGRTGIVTLQNSFHGRTMATLTLTGQQKVQDEFGPLVPDVHYVPANDSAALDEMFARVRPCGFIMEPIMAEGGGIEISADYARHARDLCDRYNTLFLADEVQTGVCRTGPFMALDALGVQADAASLAKGLGGGFPVGAFLLRSAHAELLGPGSHGSTFGGGPLASAVVRHIIDTVQGSELQANIVRLDTLVRERFARWLDQGLIRDYAGRGAWWICSPAGDVVQIEMRCREKHLLVLPTQGRLIRLLPALNIPAEEMHQGLQILEDILQATMEESE